MPYDHTSKMNDGSGAQLAHEQACFMSYAVSLTIIFYDIF